MALIPRSQRRALAFTLDGSFALLLVIGIIPVLLLVASQPVPTHHTSEYLHFLAEDSVDVLALVRISDVRADPVVANLFNSSVLDDNDLNRSVLDVLGNLWSANNSGNLTAAANLSRSLLANFVPSNLNWEFQVGGDLVYNSSNRTNSSYRVSSVSRRSASGFSRSTPTTGYVSRAYLESLIGTDVSSYFFFGGFVGQGNITAQVQDIPSDANFSKIYLELKGGSAFNLYVNDAFCQSMTVSAGNFSADNWTIIAPGCLNALVAGVPNNFSINFTANNLTDQYIGGGYVKVVYSTQQLYSGGSDSITYHFPGINGLVNLYDSFYVPGNLTSLSANLTFFTGQNYSTLLYLGNTTVLNHSGTNSTVSTFLSNSDLQANLSAHNVTLLMLSNSTIPLRLLVSANLTGGLINGTVDIVLITDLSGSMAQRLDSDTTTGALADTFNCSDPNIYLPNARRITLARCLDKDFINAVLGGNASTCTGGTPIPGNRVALVAFDTNTENWTSLQSDVAQLTATVNNYYTGTSTCISCAINKAYDILNTQSNANRSKYVVVMTDGEANIRATNACFDLTGLSNQFGVGPLGAYISRTPPWDGNNVSSSLSFYSVGSLNSSIARAGAVGGEIYKWTGSSWTLDADVGSDTIYGISLYNETLGFAVGSTGRIFRWNGLTWSQDAKPTGNTLRAVAFFNSTWAWAVGVHSGSDTGVIFYWNGTKWRAFANISNVDLYGVDGNASFDYSVAVGNNAGSTGRIYLWNTTKLWGPYAEVANLSKNWSTSQQNAGTGWMYQYFNSNGTRINMTQSCTGTNGSQSSCWKSGESAKTSTGLYPRTYNISIQTGNATAHAFPNLAFVYYFQNLGNYTLNGTFWCKGGTNCTAGDGMNYSVYLNGSSGTLLCSGTVTGAGNAFPLNCNLGTNIPPGSFVELDVGSNTQSSGDYGNMTATVYGMYVVGGASWRQNSTAGNTHNDVAILNRTAIFSVNDNGNVYRFNGGSWAATALQGTTLEGVAVLNDTHVYAAGTVTNNPAGVTPGDLFEFDGGTWRDVNATFYYRGNSTLGVNCNDDDSCSLKVWQSYSSLNANYSTGRIYYGFNNVTVDSVGFGPISTCTLGNDTITEIARTGNGSSYSSSNASELRNIYCQIANNIATKQTQTQQISSQGNLQNAILDPRSYIKFNYVPDVASTGYQEITLSAETSPFPGCNGSFFIPSGFTLTDAKLTSYSGAFWTKSAFLRSSKTANAYRNIYNLSVYGINYTSLGDPYHIYYPVSLLSQNATNDISDVLGLNATDVSPTCSVFNKFIYTFRLRAYAPFSGIFQTTNGSNVTVYYDRDHDGVNDGFINVAIGAGQPGFNATPINVSDLDPVNNALHDSLIRLLDQINFVVTGANYGRSGAPTNPVDVILASNVKIETDVLTFIPNVWGPVDMNVVLWK